MVMAICLKLDNVIYQCPPCFVNFYNYYRFITGSMITAVDRLGYYDGINELLNIEPCNVKYVEFRYDTGIWESWLEFDTDEDYTTFVLRWS